MLKSTHRVVAQPPLAVGWTEHRAPTGHVYYYNTDTKKSTYTRPIAEAEPEELQIDYGATQPDVETQAGLNAMHQFHKNNDPSQQRTGHFTGGRSYQDRDRDQRRPNRQGDRPKTRSSIPNCAPWMLVKTKYGRRFVHNTETNESFWKFPSEVMMAVIEMDRLEWEKKKQAEEQKEQARAEAEAEAEQTEETPTVDAKADAARAVPADYDSDEYEEVEVTDDEDEGGGEQTSKRPRLEEPSNEPESGQPPPGPQELTEDDIAWQLAQMEADDVDPGYDFDYGEEVDEEEGLQLTKDDKDALFRALLDEYQISPFSTFDALIDTNTPTANAAISDERWTALPNMTSRRTAFDAWSRDRVAQRNINDAMDGTGQANGSARKAGKLDPRVAYLRFLAKEATIKLYWPEFKRKFKKAPEMTDRYFPDKDREKLYREYIIKLKTSESDRKKELMSLLRCVPAEDWTDGEVPPLVEKDIRFYGVRDEKSRNDLVEGFVATMLRS